MRAICRRTVFLVPLALAYCSDDDADVSPSQFASLRYDYLPPIQLNVSSIDVQQRFIPSGVPPDVTGSDPAPPIEALRTMANDRLQALGTANKATFAILDASLTRTKDVIRGQLAVSLTITDDAGKELGFAQAHVERSHAGRVANLRQDLYDMTKAMMDDMNIEFEYQVRRNLKEWLTSSAAPDTPVRQDPLDQAPTN
jgi:hypothetical protein